MPTLSFTVPYLSSSFPFSLPNQGHEPREHLFHYRHWHRRRLVSYLLIGGPALGPVATISLLQPNWISSVGSVGDMPVAAMSLPTDKAATASARGLDHRNHDWDTLIKRATSSLAGLALCCWDFTLDWEIMDTLHYRKGTVVFPSQPPLSSYHPRKGRLTQPATPPHKVASSMLIPNFYQQSQWSCTQVLPCITAAQSWPSVKPLDMQLTFSPCSRIAKKKSRCHGCRSHFD